MFEGIVISGGGLHGISYIGALKALEEKYELSTIKEYAGTSIGSLVCLCLNINMKIDNIKDIIDNKYFFDKKDINICNFNKQYGIDTGERMKLLIIYILNKQDIHINVTFQELFDIYRKKLTITGTNLTLSVIEYFNHEKTPHMRVLDAILISSRIPILFTQYTYNNQVYLDGGLLDNFPFEQIQAKKSLGIKTKCVHNVKEYTIFTYIYQIFETVRSNIENKKIPDDLFIIEIDNGNIPILTYDYTEYINELYMNGYTHMHKMIKQIKE